MTKGALSEEEANELVLEHRGWTESIARSVARGWDLDWELDGLDGAAMEALIFCSRRFDPARGVPFRGYARKRIHEASTEAARRSKGWAKGSSSKTRNRAREISMELLDIFPELRVGELTISDDGDPDTATRTGIRQLLAGATVIAAKQGASAAAPDELLDYKRTIEYMAEFETVHQLLLWKVYWEGQSMRGVATEWNTDELNVIREHKAILAYLQKLITRGKVSKDLRVRPGLKDISLKLRKQGVPGPFSKLMGRE